VPAPKARRNGPLSVYEWNAVLTFGGVVSSKVYVLVPPFSVNDGFVAQAENGVVELLRGPM
jgi:hypothetical protein